MRKKTKDPTIIFDWGGTLYDSSLQALLPEARKVLASLAKRHPLLLVSLVSGDMEERLKTFDDCGLRSFFKSVTFVKEDKDAAYEDALKKYSLDPTRVAVVDDRAVRGIAWGNRRGATTIWLQRGKWKDERPLSPPTHIITGLSELLPIFGVTSKT